MTDSGRVAAVLALSLVVASVAAVASAGVAGAADPVGQETAVSLDGDGVTAVVSYDVPSNVAELTVRFPALETGDATVVGMRGFDRVDGTAFEWTGGDDPRIEVALAADDRRVLTGDGWALVVRPDTAVSYRYRGSDPGVETTYVVDGDGYAASPIAYLGPHEATAVGDDERTTFVVAATADDPDLGPASGFLRVAPGRFDFGVRHDRTTVFVLPERGASDGRHLTGATAVTSLWVDADALRIDSTDTTFTHEYVHTRLGAVGTSSGSARWLTEASAEYFGRVFALNYGAGSYAAFREGVRSERYAPNRTAVTLSEPASWEGTLADYGKGAHVLAALDAEIRARTDGRHTLADVFAARRGPYGSHAAFRRSVVDVTGAPGLGDWLDRYVTTDALPPLPDDPGRYVYGPDLDPDGDGVASGEERTAGTNPFVADATAGTSTPTATATPTPTATSATPEPTTASATATERRSTTGAGDGMGASVAVLAVATLAAVAAAARGRR